MPIHCIHLTASFRDKVVAFQHAARAGLCLLAMLVAFCSGALPCAAAEVVAGLRVYPPNIDLTSGKDRQRLVVQWVEPNGITRDVSADATFDMAHPDLLRREQDTFYGLADGTTEVKVGFGGQYVTVPIQTKNVQQVQATSFKLDVMPVFMKAGCNSGSCHGAARGKDGFRLSLFGYDPDGDYQRITREQLGRRVDLSVPEASLLV